MLLLINSNFSLQTTRRKKVVHQGESRTFASDYIPIIWKTIESEFFVSIFLYFKNFLFNKVAFSSKLELSIWVNKCLLNSSGTVKFPIEFCEIFYLECVHGYLPIGLLFSNINQCCNT